MIHSRLMRRVCGPGILALNLASADMPHEAAAMPDEYEMASVASTPRALVGESRSSARPASPFLPL